MEWIPRAQCEPDAPGPVLVYGPRHSSHGRAYFAVVTFDWTGHWVDNDGEPVLFDWWCRLTPPPLPTDDRTPAEPRKREATQ